MSEEMYRQCTLEKREGDAYLSRVTWGPVEKLIVGREVKVEEDDGTWTHGWIVKAVHSDPLPKKVVMHMSRAYTRQRRGSDI